MIDDDTFKGIVASLHEAVLDDARWPATSALIDEACGLQGNAVMIGEGTKDGEGVSFVGLYYRGERREDLEREYLQVYHPVNECLPRVGQLPDSRVVRIADLYTTRELRTSRTYNEALLKGCCQDASIVRLDVREGCYITWTLADPVTSRGWGASELALVEALLPHIRHFVRVRQALVGAGALSSSVIGLLDNAAIGVIQLDGRGRIVAANDRARAVLQHGDGLSDGGGVLRADVPSDNVRLGRLVADAVPFAGVAVGGSMLVGRGADAAPFVVHVRPAPAPQTNYGAQNVSALVLIVEPGRRQPRIDPAVVAATLGLTAAESQVAVCLAEGRSVRDIAVATGRKESSIHWHLKQIYHKRGFSRQADLVRLVLSISEFA